MGGAVDVLYLHKDASSSEGKDDTNTSGSSSSDSSSSGSAATVTPSDDTKKDDKPEQTTESKNVTATTASGEKAEVTVIVTKRYGWKSNGSKCRSDRYQGRDFCRYGEQDRGSCRNRPCGNYCKCYR